MRDERHDPAAALEGVRVLLVEDEALVALSVEDALRDQGCADVLVALRLDEAVQTASKAEVDVAILDVNLSGSEVFPVADVLLQRGIPFVFATGYGPETLRSDLRGRPVVRKPYSPSDLREAIGRLVPHRATASTSIGEIP